MADTDLIAKFLAEKGATQVASGLAYGVDADADKVKRRAERERQVAERAEQRAERYAEQTREAYHVGGSSARDEVVRGWR